jgi:peptidoglycan hydrolase-like protein with peptidoglycan-binding domain
MEKVKKRQRLLNFLSDAEGRFYYDGPIDGKDGPKTQEGAERFLRDYGFTAEVVPDKNVGSKSDFWSEIEFFSRDEFRCPCPRCGGFPVEPDETMVRNADEIRRRLGVPVSVVDDGGSGVRCPEHNAEVGGVNGSQHLLGKAADLHSSKSPEEMYRVAEEVFGDTGGIGIYSWGIHIDSRPVKARWKG